MGWRLLVAALRRIEDRSIGAQIAKPLATTAAVVAALVTVAEVRIGERVYLIADMYLLDVCKIQDLVT